jgi:hypothetical protein
MSIDQITIEGVRLRHQVFKLVLSNISEAYRIESSIRHPWYKCQSLSKVAEYSTKTTTTKILTEAFDSAMNCHDENRRVSVACWPISVAINNGLHSLAANFLDECSVQLNHDIDPISKWCGAANLLRTIKADLIFLDSFFDTFKHATSKGHGWRVVRDIKPLLNDTDIQKDPRYIQHLNERLDAIINWKKSRFK